MGQIVFSVPVIEQGDNPICWLACVAMITSFKTSATHGIGEFIGGADPSSSCIPDPNNSWDDLYANLRKFGFTPDGANMTLGADYIESTLRNHGPFMMYTLVQDFPFYGPLCVNMNGSPTDSHALVVAGINTKNGKVKIVNPWGTVTPLVDIDVASSAMQAIADSGNHCAAYMA